MRLFIIFICFISYSFSSDLQDAIDQAKPYSTIKLFDATYNGNITINKPLTIVGKNNTIIKGDNKGNVITINSQNVTLKNLIITNSGNDLHNLHSAILLNKANYFKLKNSKILNCLYGINFNISNNCIIENNYIKSKNLDIPQRGDALKIWYSNNNIIQNNIIEKSRDVTLTYANNNQLINNKFLYNRFSTHISQSKNNLIQNNIYKYNSVNIMLMGTKNIDIIKNKILSANGVTGLGIVIGGGKNIVIKQNQISYNTQAIYIDNKNTEIGMNRYFINNTISYNKEAFHFHAPIINNTIKYNNIFANIDDVVQDIYMPFNDTNQIEYNYWDRYNGFDKNKDGIVDTKYKMYSYSDWLWHYDHHLKFFHSSVAMSLINFINQIAPFTQPKLLLIDNKPKIYKNKTTYLNN
jgi:nitrous oxidase accessory protein